MKDEQYYSKIAFNYIKEKIKQGDVHCNMVTYGNLGMMEDLFDLFGGDRNYIRNHDLSMHQWQSYRFNYVMNRLERESKKSTALFKKIYISYRGIINRPTRGFKIIENNKD